MKKPYVCYACKDGHHSLCASDLNPKKVCKCDEVWHYEVTDKKVVKFKGEIRQESARVVAP